MEKKQARKKTGPRWTKWMKYAPLAVMLLCAALFLILGRDISYRDILAWVPRAPIAAALFVILLYAAKSMTVFFPLWALNVLTGLAFPPAAAVLVNTAGTFVCVSIPYLIGWYAVADGIKQLEERYPKLELLNSFCERGAFQSAALCRMLGVVPCDIASLYFGSLRQRYLPYALGSTLGLCPYTIIWTILGATAFRPGSPGFIAALGCAVLAMSLSLILGRKAVRHTQAKENKDHV